jgi:signal transduction histidine kinase
VDKSVATGKEAKGKAVKEIRFSSAGTQIQHILDAFPFYVLLVDSAHNIVATNRKLVQDLQLNPQQLMGCKCPMLIHGIDSPIADCPLVEAVEKGNTVERDLFDSANSRWIRAAVFPTSMVTDIGEPIYLHFARDITKTRTTEEKLTQSLEHHAAMSELLQRFQHCQTSSQILDALITEVISLSWLGMATTAIGFLAKNNRLEMAVQYNVAPGQLSRCKSVEFGECLCGKTAEAGRMFVCSSDCTEHTVHYEGMERHRHVVLPIRHEGWTLGVVALYLKSEEEPNPFQLDFLNAAVSAAGVAMAVQFSREEVKRVRERSLAQVFSYQEDERKRISRELHDQVCQSLSALLLEMQARGSIHESLRGLQRDCEVRVRALIDEVRNMAAQLRPTILDDYGLEMALARHIEDRSSTSGLAIDYQYVSHPETQGRLPAAIEVGIYRVATEALSNIIAHASASRASVIVLQQNSKLMLLVEDDGHGFDYASIRKDLDRCQGLIGMEERIALMGGTFRIESTPQNGTMLRAEVPVENAPVENGTPSASAV